MGFLEPSGSNFQDPRRLDPRRGAISPGGVAASTTDDTGATKLEVDDPVSSNTPVSHPVASTNDNTPSDLTMKIKNDDMVSEGPPVSAPDGITPKTEVVERPGEVHQNMEENAFLDPSIPLSDLRDEDISTEKLSDDTGTNGPDSPSMLEFDEFSPDVQVASTSEDTCLELPQLPPYVQQSKEQESKVKHMAIMHIIESYKHLHGTDCQQFCMPLLARLVAQVENCFFFIMFRDLIVFKILTCYFHFLFYIVT